MSEACLLRKINSRCWEQQAAPQIERQAAGKFNEHRRDSPGQDGFSTRVSMSREIRILIHFTHNVSFHAVWYSNSLLPLLGFACSVVFPPTACRYLTDNQRSNSVWIGRKFNVLILFRTTHCKTMSYLFFKKRGTSPEISV